MKQFRRTIAVVLLTAVSGAGLILPYPAQADVPGLQIAPLQYEDTLRAGQVKSGYIDVSNPGDASVDITSSVKGFSQIDSRGNLKFFDDSDLSNAITVGLGNFTLGPREAVRVGFSVDPGKLPQGGIYAAIFFRTQPPGQTSTSSYISESANVGTLLMLTNGSFTTHYGRISQLKLPFWQFGYGISGTLDYLNTDHTAHPVGFKPSLDVRILPWGSSPKLTTGLVLPGVTRTFQLTRTGSFFGLLPVIITDSDTHSTSIAWVFACTGWYAYAWLIVLTLLITYIIGCLARRKPILPAKLRALLKKSRSGKPVQVLIDGIGPKSK